LVKNKNYRSLKQKDCYADDCSIFHPAERWMIYVLNLLFLQRYATSGDVKSFRW